MSEKLSEILQAACDGMLPDALVPVATEWYELCEHAGAVDKIKISGDLARAIVKAVCTQVLRLDEAAAIVKRYEEGIEARVMGGRSNSFGGFHVEIAHDAGWHTDQFVRIVVEEG